MKYGEALQQRSVPEWAPYNVDYNELKYLIRVNTTRDQAQAIPIPGHVDNALQKFENLFFAELWDQHDRVDLFVKSKADEYSRRLGDYQKKLIDLLARINFETQRGVSVKRRANFIKLENRILSCGEDIKNLERFVTAQKIAFQKILKKYKKWTGSTILGSRFTDGVLSSPKSFTKRDFGPLHHQYDVLIALLRQSATPFQSGANTPSVRSHPEPQPSNSKEPDSPQSPQQKYWNEYDDGSEAGDANEPYTIYINPDADTSFPGVKTVVYVISQLGSTARIPVEKVRSWLGQYSTSEERRPLFSGRQDTSHPAQPDETGTDVDDDTSFSDSPSGYETYYATFPSISDQKMAKNRERLLFRGTVASFVAAFLLLFVAALLAVTGRNRLHIEVDAGVIVGVVSSLFFATLGFTTMLCRRTPLGFLHIACVSLSFLATCILNGFLLVLVMGNTRL